MAEQRGLGFGGLLRQLRAGAGLTQEELAEAAGLSPRSVSDLERGIHPTARKDTAELLAGALGLAGPARRLFVAAARGRAPAEQVLAALDGDAVAAGVCPFKGLAFFDRADAEYFCGRERLVADPVARPQRSAPCSRSPQKTQAPAPEISRASRSASATTSTAATSPPGRTA